VKAPNPTGTLKVDAPAEPFSERRLE